MNPLTDPAVKDDVAIPYVLETGSIVASGTADAISADDTIRKAYLGF
jgi:ABC-type lipopolysaccharide export system ATPase subunit